jgi:hypothetical protein
VTAGISTRPSRTNIDAAAIMLCYVMLCAAHTAEQDAPLEIHLGIVLVALRQYCGAGCVALDRRAITYSTRHAPAQPSTAQHTKQYKTKAAQ